MKNVFEPMDNRAFQIDCSVNPTGSFRAGANSLSVKIGQRISRFGAEEIWESVIVQGSTTGGELTVRVLVCNPDWDEPLQIACVRSNRSSKHTSENGHSIDCYLEHVVT